jgi:hypothetical protein
VLLPLVMAMMKVVMVVMVVMVLSLLALLREHMLSRSIKFATAGREIHVFVTAAAHSARGGGTHLCCYDGFLVL